MWHNKEIMIVFALIYLIIFRIESLKQYIISCGFSIVITEFTIIINTIAYHKLSKRKLVILTITSNYIGSQLYLCAI